jgi:ketosteroid isomerase-like protein
MSQEDIETLRLGYEAASRRDWDRSLRSMHPDIEWVSQRLGTYHGHTEVRRFLEETAQPFKEVIYEPEEFFERGDQVVVYVHFRARPPGTQAVVENRIGHVWTMRDGKAVRCQTFPRREEALEAAGLRE